MAAFETIETQEQLEQWLKTQDARVSRAIAARASLRVLPALMAVVDQKIASNWSDYFVFACIRAVFVTGVASTCPTSEMKEIEHAARSALSVADTAARSAIATIGSNTLSNADFTIFSAARSALSAVHASTDTVSLGAFGAVHAAAESAADPTAYSAACLDANTAIGGTHNSVFETTLWPPDASVDALISAWETFAARPDPDGIWTFWRSWYRGMLNGTPMDWDLQLQVAKIEDAIWDAGPEAVAKAIAEIQSNFRKADLPLLDADQMATQARALQARPVTTHTVCSGAADQIETAVHDFLLQAKCNQLPLELEPLYHLPATLRSISDTSQNDDSYSELQVQLEQLIGQVATLTSQLEKYKASSDWKTAKDTAIKVSVGLATTAFWGVLAAAFSYSTGIVDLGSLLERFSKASEVVPMIIENAPPAEWREPIDI
jgi:hypothetical protein